MPYHSGLEFTLYYAQLAVGFSTYFFQFDTKSFQWHKAIILHYKQFLCFFNEKCLLDFFIESAHCVASARKSA